MDLSRVKSYLIGVRTNRHGRTGDPAESGRYKCQIFAASNHLIDVVSMDDSAKSRSSKPLVDVDQDSLSITLHTLDV